MADADLTMPRRRKTLQQLEAAAVGTQSAEALRQVGVLHQQAAQMTDAQFESAVRTAEAALIGGLDNSYNQQYAPGIPTGATNPPFTIEAAPTDQAMAGLMDYTPPVQYPNAAPPMAYEPPVQYPNAAPPMAPAPRSVWGEAWDRGGEIASGLARATDEASGVPLFGTLGRIGGFVGDVINDPGPLLTSGNIRHYLGDDPDEGDVAAAAAEATPGAATAANDPTAPTAPRAGPGAGPGARTASAAGSAGLPAFIPGAPAEGDAADPSPVATSATPTGATRTAGITKAERNRDGEIDLFAGGDIFGNFGKMDPNQQNRVAQTGLAIASALMTSEGGFGTAMGEALQAGLNTYSDADQVEFRQGLAQRKADEESRDAGLEYQAAKAEFDILQEVLADPKTSAARKLEAEVKLAELQKRLWAARRRPAAAAPKDANASRYGSKQAQYLNFVNDRVNGVLASSGVTDPNQLAVIADMAEKEAYALADRVFYGASGKGTPEDLLGD